MIPPGTDFHRKVFLYLFYAIAFAIPVYGRLLPVLVGLLVLNWLIEGKYLKTCMLIFREWPRFLTFSFSFLYLLYLAGLLYTSNFQYAGIDLSIKFSIFIFPVIFATSDFPIFTRREAENILKVFAAGCIAGSLLLTGRAFYYSVFLHQDGAFYYSRLSWSFHPSYFSMYLAFAVSNILYFFLIRRTVKGFPAMAVHVLILLFFTLMIVLLSSKAGLLTWLVIIVMYAFILVLRYRQWVTGVLFTAAALSAFMIFLSAFPIAASRVLQAKQDLALKDSVENPEKSTGDRIVIWKAAAEIIQKNYLFGVGTGDVKDALLEQYRVNHLGKVLQMKLNAHNQYLQTLISIGIPGLLTLVAMLIFPGIGALRREDYIYFIFLAIFAVNMMVESMLEAQAGVIFYALFNVLLYTSSLSRVSDDTPDNRVSQARS